MPSSKYQLRHTLSLFLSLQNRSFHFIASAPFGGVRRLLLTCWQQLFTVYLWLAFDWICSLGRKGSFHQPQRGNTARFHAASRTDYMFFTKSGISLQGLQGLQGLQVRGSFCEEQPMDLQLLFLDVRVTISSFLWLKSNASLSYICSRNILLLDLSGDILIRFSFIILSFMPGL